MPLHLVSSRRLVPDAEQTHAVGIADIQPTGLSNDLFYRRHELRATQLHRHLNDKAAAVRAAGVGADQTT